ncbi:hypothetical protein KSB_35450 [Ktedonobacter robiniae]|uniref:Uncharacterized protein n=1 Tax=Ktedonobacter robiniae TaxID=2778365 RepID=A0ABQ3URJ7_9CHLR|nr:hypothetical protein KSB_35450 [Ktedonobacter robiniae]
MCHSLKRGPEWGMSQLSNDFGRHAHSFRLEEFDRLTSTTRRYQLGELCREILWWPRSTLINDQGGLIQR